MRGQSVGRVQHKRTSQNGPVSLRSFSPPRPVFYSCRGGSETIYITHHELSFGSSSGRPIRVPYNSTTDGLCAVLSGMAIIATYTAQAPTISSKTKIACIWVGNHIAACIKQPSSLPAQKQAPQHPHFNDATAFVSTSSAALVSPAISLRRLGDALVRHFRQF